MKLYDPGHTRPFRLTIAGCQVASSLAQTPSRFDEPAHLEFANNRPTKGSAQTLRDELLFQRATQTYLWELPLVNTLGMKVGSEKTFGAGYHVHLEETLRRKNSGYNTKL